MQSIYRSETNFYKTIQSRLKFVYLYENINLLKYAADLVPIEELNMKATLKLSLLEETDDTIVFEDVLLLELLNWFKFSFFSWVDVPNCNSCGMISERHGNISPDESEIHWGANTVELYYCPNCQLIIRFPRYDHPKKLLETRRGRCGEWANCFTLLCRALGYDARLVFDWNDHVWTEVFSFSKNRWLHCDSCENICDKPLLYELGWKKPISYVIAFSKDEIQDVTWRYTSNFLDVMNRRNLCREKWLISCILSFTEKLQANTSTERKKELVKRRVLELAQFLSEPTANIETLGGRTSGSLAWRIARGETHLASGSNYVFKLSDNEMKQKHLHIKYNCASDGYIRLSDHSTKIERWTSCTFSYDNIMRKIELDWKMVYLARTEGSSKGTIKWKFDFTGSGLAIETVTLHFKSVTFECGKIKWSILSNCNPNPKFYNPDEITSLETHDFKGSLSLIICAELSEGQGSCAWQHAQLFRQAVDSTDFPFEVQISLDNL